jgi:hypothetical protein
VFLPWGNPQHLKRAASAALSFAPSEGQPYYPGLELVVEYNERQHSEAVPFFDRRVGASGMSRGEQRKIYDRRKQEVLPQYGIAVVVFSFNDFAHGSGKRLKRVPDDIAIVRNRLSPWIRRRERVNPGPGLCDRDRTGESGSQGGRGHRP